MPFDRFLIAPFNSGFQTNLKSWLLPEDAFSQLVNAYVFRGRVRKRFGSILMGPATGAQSANFSRLRINIGTTDGAGNFAGTVPGNIFKIGQVFTVGNAFYSVYQNGSPAAMLATQGSGTYNTSNGAVTISGAPALTAVFFYPAEPVMGLTIYESGPINNQPSYAFDTQFAYVFTGGAWQRSGTGTTPQWHGTDLNFFWEFNWQGTVTSTTSPPVMFVTNFYAVNPNGAGNANDDPIWAFDGTNWISISGANGFYFRPNGGAPRTGPFVKTARIIVAFKNRLLLLNTIENDGGGAGGTNTNYVNRVRFSAFASPFAPNAWYEPGQQDNTGNPLTGIAIGGDFLDATTEEQIISAEFIKDRLIVFFQRSTWELAYTGNEVEPFRWQKINTELGADAQQSSVPFDKEILTIGNVGVHACNGANVERIDGKIPDQIFEIADNGTQRVAGIRDYYVEVVYWTYPSENENPNNKYPNRILLYNYKNDTWAINEDCITAFGYFEQQSGEVWSANQDTWEEASYSWNSGFAATQFRQVIAGNQEGFVYIVAPDVSNNAAVMYVTNAVTTAGITTLTIINHTLDVGPYGDYIYIINSNVGIDGIYPVLSVVDANTVTIKATVVGTYKGGATVARVSNPQILSKQWNPYINIGQNVYLARIDFGVQKTSSGQITVDYYPSSTELSMLQAGQDTGTNPGNGVLETTPYDVALYPLEQFQDLLWHPIYFQSTGEFIQIFMYLTNDQIIQQPIAFADFELQGMVLHTSRSSARLQ